MQDHNFDSNMLEKPVSKPLSVLILGGTTEAYQLAEILESQPINITTSLAGRTTSPRIPKGNWRIGGFGGVEGLITYLLKEKTNLIIDATHPFARQMTDHAYEASRITKIPLLRLERPLWKKQDGDTWLSVPNISEALTVIPKGKNILLAIGRQHIAPFANFKDSKFWARMIDYPDNIDELTNLEFIIGYPTDSASEKKLLIDKKIDLIICRNSGGNSSYGKVKAARELSIPIIMIERTSLPTTITVHSIDAVLGYLKHI
ncbi:cobalt-precorrin-6A reductase [Bartonella sp. HY038]|uniref:cobalt-precorrin-6A reductase n=1 Tax=Bartonella sp. HY038 TaxID=2759660 RepID=UPI0015FD5521|nr:cobalt-precorrin-6A reductase [Bartonella sp. HY038]